MVDLARIIREYSVYRKRRAAANCLVSDAGDGDLGGDFISSPEAERKRTDCRLG